MYHTKNQFVDVNFSKLSHKRTLIYIQVIVVAFMQCINKYGLNFPLYITYLILNQFPNEASNNAPIYGLIPLKKCTHTHIRTLGSNGNFYSTRVELHTMMTANSFCIFFYLRFVFHAQNRHDICVMVVGNAYTK